MKLNIGSGEDFVYEPSWCHTSATFNARMAKRMAEARKDQSAFKAEEERSNGSVNMTVPWRDESGFGEAMCAIPLDEFEQAMGG